MDSTDARVDYVIIPPDGGWGWFVVIVAFFWNILVDGTSYTFALFMGEMLLDFEVSQSILMVASSTQMGLYYILGPLVAAMINRLGFRTVAIIGATFAFTGVLSSAFVNNIYLFIFCFGCIVGCGFSMTYMCNILIVGFYFAKYRAVATCIAVTGTAVGVSIFPLFFSVIIENMTWREKYQIISGCHLAMALFALVYKPIPFSEVVMDQRKTIDTDVIWNEWEKEHPNMGIAGYPTNAEVLQNKNYTVQTLREQDVDSKLSVRSTKTLRLMSTSTVPYSFDGTKYARRKCCCCHCKCKYIACPCLWHDARPMYRDDILYHGATEKLEQFNASTATLHNPNYSYMSYMMNVTRTTHLADTPQNADCCNCCPDSVNRVLRTMMDFSLIKSISFFLLCLSGFLTYLGFYVPYMHGIELSIQYNVEKTKASYVLTAIGVSNGLGRIVSGVLPTAVPKLSPMVISEVSLVVAGAACIVHPFFSSFAAHLTCACVFGFNIATISSLRTIVVVDLLGLEKLTNAFGLIVLFEGVSSLLSMPLNAALYESYDDLRVPFVFSGIMIVLSGGLLLPVEVLHKIEKKRAQRREQLKREKQYEEAFRIATTSRKIV